MEEWNRWGRAVQSLMVSLNNRGNWGCGLERRLELQRWTSLPDRRLRVDNAGGLLRAAKQRACGTATEAANHVVWPALYRFHLRTWHASSRPTVTRRLSLRYVLPSAQPTRRLLVNN